MKNEVCSIPKLREVFFKKCQFHKRHRNTKELYRLKEPGN